MRSDKRCAAEYRRIIKKYRRGKLRSWLSVAALAGLLGLVAMPGDLHAATLTWDANGATAPNPQDNFGNWLDANRWWNGSTNVNWSSATPDDAIFGTGSGGTSDINVYLGGAATVGTLTFANYRYNIIGNNSPLTINNGIVANANGLINVPIVLGGANTWNVAAGKTLTIPFTVTRSGTGTLTKTGTGTLDLDGDSVMGVGATRVEAGTLLLGSSALRYSTLDTANGNGTVAFNSKIASVGQLTGSGNIALVFSTFSVDLSIGYNNTTQIYSGILSGAGSVTKVGTGGLTLSNANTFTGPTRISAGQLTLGHSLALQGSTLDMNGSDAGTLSFGTLTAATLGQLTGSRAISLQNELGAAVTLTIGANNTSPSFGYSGVLTGGGNLIKVGSGTFGIGNDANTFSGTTRVVNGTLIINTALALQNSTLDLNAADAGSVNFGFNTSATLGHLSGSRNLAMPSTSLAVGNNNSSQTYTGILSGTFTTLTKTGTGSWTLGNANTHSGVTRVAAGQLILDHNLALQNSTLDWNVVDSGTISFGTLTTATLGNLSGARPLTLSNASSTAVALSVGNNNNSLTYSGDLAGNGSLTKIGTGTLTLSGNNSHSGGTTISAGVLSVASSGNLGAAGGALTFNGGTLLVTGTALGNLNGRPISLAAAGGTFNIASASNALALNQEITGAGSLTKSGPGRLILTAANSYSGATTVSAGSLLATHGNAFNPSGGGAVTVASGAAFLYQASADIPLNLRSTFALTGGTGSVLGVSLGTTPTSTVINVSGAATITGTVMLNIYRLGGGFIPGTYTLLQGGAGSSLGGATYLVNNPTNYTATPSASSSSLQLTLAGATPLAAAYWKGGLNGAASVWASSNGFSASNWSATSEGSVQSLVPGAGADVFVSGLAPATAPTTTTLGADMAIRSLTILNSLGLNADGNALTVGAGGITMESTAQSSTLAANLVLGASQSWANHSFAGLAINGVVSGSTGLIKEGMGTITLGGANTFTGGITVNSGTLAIANDANLGNTENGVALNAGGTLRFNSAASLVASRVITVNGTLANPSGLNLAFPVTQVIGAGQLAGSGVLQVSQEAAQGVLSIEGANPGLTGSLLVGAPGTLVGTYFSPRVSGGNSGAILRLQNTGSIANVPSITINHDSGLWISQSATAITGRIGAAVPLTFHSGRFQYDPSANGGAAISDSFGAVTVTGQLSINGSAVAGPAAGTTLNFGTLTRTDRATMLFQASQPGTAGAIGGPAGSTSERIFFANLTSDTATSGTTRSVIPWAANTAKDGTQPSGFMTYDANGFRPLNTSTEVVTLALNTLTGALTGTNVQTAANQVIRTGGQTINTFANTNTSAFPETILTGTATADTSGNVLTITSGGLATGAPLAITDATINLPNGGYFHLGWTLAVNGNSRLTGTSGLVVAALSPLTALNFQNTPTGGNTFTGGLYINGNTSVNFTLNNQLGNDGSGRAAGEIVLGGGRLSYGGSAGTVVLADGAISRAIRVNGSNGTITAGSAFSSTTPTILQIPGPISGVGQVQFGGLSATTIVELTNPGANTYSGGTIIAVGVLRISNANQLGTGAILLNGGTLQASANLNLPAMTLVSGSTIDSQANEITLAAPLVGGGALTKTGSGRLILSGSNLYTGGTTVTDGTLFESATAWLPDAGSLTINGSGAIFDLGANHSDTVGTVTLQNGGSIVGTGNSALIVNGGQTFALQSGTVSAILAGGAALNKTTSGVVTLTAANTFTGATTISAGTLVLTHAAALNPTTGGAVTVAAGGGLAYRAAADAPLVLASTLSLANGITLGASLGSTATSSAINVAGAATAAGTVTLNLYQPGGIVPGTYTLIQGGVGSTLSAGNYIINGGSNRTFVLTASANAVQVTIANATALATAYWLGGLPGATNTWSVTNGAGASNWSTTANGPAQALVPDSITDVIIGPASRNSDPISSVATADMAFRSLRVGTAISLSGSPLTIGAGGITIEPGVGASGVFNNVVLGATQTWTNNSYGAFTISGVISGNADLIKTGVGTMALSALNTFTGNVYVNDGVLLASNSTLGNASNGVILGPGGAIRLSGQTPFAPTRVFTVNGTASNPSGFSTGAQGNVIFGVGQLAGSGVARFSLFDNSQQSGTMIVQGASAGFTGEISVGAPGQMVGAYFSPRNFDSTTSAILRFQTDGALPNASRLTFQDNALFNIRQPATAITGRTGTGTILAFNSSSGFKYDPSTNGGVAINDTFGPMEVTGLMSFIGSSMEGPAAGTTLNFGNLTRNDRASMIFRAAPAGTQGGFGGVPSAASTRIFFANLVPDTTSSGVTRSVLPWAAQADLAELGAWNFMTYDANGLRPLTASEVFVNGLALAPAGANVMGSGTIAGGGQTINSYATSNTTSLNGSATVSSPGDILTITSGGMAIDGQATISNATLNFPNGAFLYVAATNTVSGNSRFTGSSGVAVSSLGSSFAYALRFTNTPNGGNTFTGGLYVNGYATVNFTQNNQLGNDGSGFAAGEVVLGGGQLIFRPASATTLSLKDGVVNRPIRVNGAHGTIGTAVASAILQIPGTISGPGQVQFGGGQEYQDQGIVELTNTGANTYSGGTLISTGILVISNENQLGTGPVIFNMGVLRTNSSVTFSNTPILANYGTVDTSAQITFNAGLTGAGYLNKTGAGRVILGGTSTYTGSTIVLAGTLAEAANGSIADSSVLTINGATAVFDLGADHDDMVRSVTLQNGSITGTGTSTLSVAVGQTFALQSGSVSARLSGGGAVTKTTSGTVTLSGANSYTGATTVSAGVLVVSGSISGSVATVAASGTLNVTGTITTPGNLTVNGILSGGSTNGLTGKIDGESGRIVVNSGGGLSPGTSGNGLSTTAILKANSLAASTGAHLDIQLGGTTAGTLYDKVVVDSASPTAIDLNATNTGAGMTLNLTLSGYTYNYGDKFFIVENVNATGSVHGLFSNVIVPNGGFDTITAGGVTFAVGYSGDAGTNSFTGGNDVVLMAVPEPGSAWTLASGFAGLLGLSRFRRRRACQA